VCINILAFVLLRAGKPKGVAVVEFMEAEGVLMLKIQPQYHCLLFVSLPAGKSKAWLWWSSWTLAKYLSCTLACAVTHAG
jgi:hypothetical protein